MEPTGRDPLAGRRIGHYRLETRLGEGGMGVVYLAERQDEFRKRVAVKLVRCAMDSAEILRRFETERQTMAALAHPNIVALLDAGSTEDGQPYLVMEYVKGAPLNQYCAAAQLGASARIAIFLQVCDAVQYAHRNLVVHCDLKPGNILVGEDGRPKLLDFGIAKLLGARTPEMAALMTAGGPRPFTPKYASPEQVLGRPVSTASDVYSLGVILCELLTGKSPYCLGTHSDAEMVSAVCFHEPARPSTLDAARRIDPDLDAIVLKALRKEPENRYTSVEQFAADLRRHLDGLPVTARKGDFRYRAEKFVRRNRVPVAAGAVAALALILGVTGVVWQSRVAVVARDRAERRFQDVRALANYLLFDFHDEVQKLPGSTPVQRMLVDRGLKYLDSLAAEAHGDAGLQAELVEAYLRLGDVQGNPYTQNLGDSAGALASYRKALAIAQPLARSGAPRAVRSEALVRAHLGDVLFTTRNIKASLPETRQAADMLEKLAAAHPRDVDTHAGLAACLEGLADQTARGARDRKAALALYRKSLDEWETVMALDSRNRRARRAQAGLHMKIAGVQAEDDPQRALETYRYALSILNALPAEERSTVPVRRLEASLHNHMADALWEVQQLKESLAAYGRSISIFSELAAADPANTRAQFDLVVVLNSAGQGYEAAGDIAAALRNYTQVSNVLESLTRMDPGNLAWRANLGEILVRSGGLLLKSGKPAEARARTARGLEVARELGARPDTPGAELTRAARLLVLCEPPDLRRPDAAVALARKAVDLTRGNDPYALDTLAEAYIQAGNRDAARATIDKGLALVPSAPPGQPAPWLRRLLEAKLKRVQ